jgi:hypothetical protein
MLWKVTVAVGIYRKESISVVVLVKLAVLLDVVTPARVLSFPLVTSARGINLISRRTVVTTVFPYES